MKKYLLILIILLAGFLRLWKLGSIPPHLSPDEASIGYNAYSVLKTGRDEYGQLLPLIFKSFGDYKPGLYIYATVPFIAAFGLNEIAVRLPSVLAGVLAVWLIFLIVNKFKNLLLTTSNSQLGLIAAFLLAISPWHVYFSRGAWEANLSLTLTLIGIYFFLKSLRSTNYLILAAVSFAFTLYAYQGAKLATTIVVLILIAAYWREFKKLLTNNIVTVIQSTVIGLLIVLPIIISMFTGKTGRLEVFSIFSYPREKETLQTFLTQGNEKVGDLNYYLFHSEFLNFSRAILGRWFNHFSGRFLFFEGDWSNPRHSAPNQGMLLFSDIFLLIIGFFTLFKNKFNKVGIFVILWLILSPLPAVLSRNQVHAVRALNMVIPLTLISAFGLSYILSLLKRIKKSMLHATCYLLLTVIFLSSLIYFLDSYFIHMPIQNAKLWDYGYKQIVNAVTPIQSNYKKIVVQQSYDQPYIYFLFYQKYDPYKYQSNAKLKESSFGDVGLVETLDNITFQDYSFPYVSSLRPILIVGDGTRIPVDYQKFGFNLITDIKYPDGIFTAFRILDTE